MTTVAFKEPPKRAQPKPRASDVVRQISEDCSLIRQMHEIGTILVASDFPIIERDALRIIKSRNIAQSTFEQERYERTYSLEIGHRFVEDHVVASLRKKLNLSDEEANLVTDASGRLYQGDNSVGLRESADAAQALVEMGERGKEIFKGWVKCHAEVVEMLKMVKSELKTDMFFNPACNPALSFESFGFIAEMKRDMADRIDAGHTGGIAEVRGGSNNNRVSEPFYS